MPLQLLEAPACEPITIAVAADYLRQDASDLSIPGLLAAARSAVESYLHRALVTQKWRYLRDGWPRVDPLFQHPGFSSIVLPKPPLQSVDAFRYLDTGGAWMDLEPTNDAGDCPDGSFYGYQLDTGGPFDVARVTPAYATPWPTLRRVPNNVVIEFTCGYGALDADGNWQGEKIPASILTALKLQLGWLFNFRGDDPVARPDDLAPGVAALLRPYCNLLS